MKKTGILNAQLACELAKLRHYDKFAIVDAGYPIPPDANWVDVSLVSGVPSFPQVLKAVLDELIVQEYCIFDNMEQANPAYYQLVKRIFKNQKAVELPMMEFIESAKDCRLFIRAGEMLPSSNIVLISASGVPSMCEPLDVTFEL